MSNNAAIKKLSVFSIVMITVGSVDSIRNLPASALLGSHLIAFYIIAALCFFLPSAFVAAELSSSNTQREGIYDWVKHAFGPRAGVLAVWFQWTENLIWYPTILSFVAATVGYLVAPSLAANRFFVSAVIIVVFWSVTLVNLRGINMSAKVATFCTLAGLLLPMLLIMILGIIWIKGGHTSHLHLSWQQLWPNFKDHTVWSALTAVILSLMGIEIATVHSSSVDNPNKTYPFALCVSGIILLLTLMGGSLSIATILPAAKINPLYGIVQDFSVFFHAYHLNQLTPVLVVIVLIGVIGSVNNWVIAPTSGLRYAARSGHLPAIFNRTNKNNAPSFLLITQAIIVTVVSLVFVYLPSVTASYWFLTAVAVQQYALMYLLMFATAIKQRYLRGQDDHGYHMPGGRLMMWLIAGLGFLSMLAIVVIGFIPPASKVGSIASYEALIVAVMLLLIAPAFLMFHYANKKEA